MFVESYCNLNDIKVTDSFSFIVGKTDSDWTRQASLCPTTLFGASITNKAINGK